jgi:SAM-dependent methyltransferase
MPPTARVDQALAKYPNLEFIAGDAFDLSRFPDASIDLIWGQAALHHLSHDLWGLTREAQRILKPGGRLVFIFEPLGHNLLVAAIRAMRMARHELGDESNLFLSQFEKIGKSFISTEVQVFNLLGYPVKALSDRLAPVATFVKSCDAVLFHRFPKLMRYAANCNVIFTK